MKLWHMGLFSIWVLAFVLLLVGLNQRLAEMNVLLRVIAEKQP